MNNVGRIVIGMVIALSAGLAACGGSDTPPPADPTVAAPPPAPTAEATPAPTEPAPAETAATPPPPPVEIPASYTAADTALRSAIDKAVEALKDEKASCDKLAAALTKVAKDKDNLKARDDYFAERAKLTDEQRAEADKQGTLAAADVQQKLESASEAAGKCKGKKKFDDAVSSTVTAFTSEPTTAKK